MLNIEKALETQEFTAGGFDIVLAANVLHATTDLRTTLKHVRQLLAPGGLLVLLETTAPRRWLDLVFGLTEGWWRFADTDLRSNHALLGTEKWAACSRNLGLRPRLRRCGELRRRSPKAGRADGKGGRVDAPPVGDAPLPDERDRRQYRTRKPILSAAGRWLIFSDTGKDWLSRWHSDSREDGDECVLVQAV